MIGLILTSVFLGALGQILVKIGAVNLTLNFSPGQFVPSIISILKNFFVMSGIVSYGTSFLIWIKVLSKVELSYAYPMVSLGYVITTLFAYFFLNENISIQRILGILLIIGGVFLISRN
ncbi:SMR family transporter [Clostridium cochlearium]|uniref:Transporter n=1 Tax=Clostridium cochlearium TaxID=1494 RepID=A0A239ZZ56_CLOCO|nr:SMR family transporter [Clostridium cochlearium]MBV1818555.1 EamA family transporter [Bacteroidales bacterium MSK.15.36]NSJ92142.1 EamA family transporter [Coprococcus sp. MSK.21.13]MBE6064345.1 transporter [Clostridium cochlearium]MBU5268791.1 EamA family transporter [Clostridium cochlearium]MCG4570863.1 SMR family transporter [Clostridium cochlearium]